MSLSEKTKAELLTLSLEARRDLANEIQVAANYLYDHNSADAIRFQCELDALIKLLRTRP